ncbi:glycoside hydrolase family 27 protein [Hymenopellis radicata]|nr:glycoside hydrolase family 27 protein [Hymenopellis radicata]
MALVALAVPTVFAFMFLAGLQQVPTPTVALNLGDEVGRLPFMGYNTWNAYFCNINEDLVYNTAELMVSLGLAQDVGYNYVNIDDCYSEKQRSASGDILANAERFPSGMRNLTDKIHALGLKTGIYSDSGWFTCQMYPGSFQNEERDAHLFNVEWGFDLLKFDNCAVPFDSIVKEGQVGKFARMSNAIKDLAKTSGKPPMLFSLCEWGRLQPWLWARELGQSWRTTDDIGANWDSLAGIINQNSFHAWASDFYGHNDLDMLEIGNGQLTLAESQSHFTAWAFLKSPLLIGTDLSKVSDQALTVLKNTEIIAINQDPVVGPGVVPFRWGINSDYTFNATHPAQYWSGQSEHGTVFMLINTLDEPADMFFNLTESPWIRWGRQYSVRDLWTHTDNGTAVRNFTAKAVPPHGVAALLLKDAGDEPQDEGLSPCAFYEWWGNPWCIDQNGTKIQPT